MSAPGTGPARADRGPATDPFGTHPDPSTDQTSEPAGAGKQRPAQARPDQSEPLALEAPKRSASERIKQRFAGTLAELRFVSERPASLVEHIAYARRGEWTEEIDGPRRHVAVLFAWFVAIPISTVAYLVAWWCARPGRFFTAALVASLVGVALAQIL
ncbi:MAG: hypothetical protein J2P20_00080 [Pseudonocardia sp.]|nr:hypothetical protein [Pseudonocardia sp.]